MAKDKLEIYHDLRYPIAQLVIKNTKSMFDKLTLKGHLARLMLLFIGMTFYYFPFLYYKIFNEIHGCNSPKLYDILD